MPIHDWTKVYSGLLHDFHQTWAVYIKNALNAGLLPEGTIALVEQRVPQWDADVLAINFDDVEPRNWPPNPGGTAIMDRPRTRVVRKSDKEHYADRANRVVVKYMLGQTLAVIELVSPGNKSSKASFRTFLEKSLDYLRKGVHLLVVDVFPPSKRDRFGVHRAIWDEFEGDDDDFVFPPNKDRIVASYKAGDAIKAYVEPMAVGDAIPDTPLYLSNDFFVNVPLERAYQAAWSDFPSPMRRYVETGVNPASPTVPRKR